MVKKMISRLSVLVVLVAFLASCSSNTEYTNLIPADATAIASINLQSLVDKAGLNDKENEAIKQKMIDALKSGTNANTFQHLEKIIKNPSESGIDTQSPLYLFTSASFSNGALVAKVNSEENLRTSLDILAKEKISQPLTEGDGYQFTTIGTNSLLAFNQTAAIIVQTTGTSQTEEMKKSLTTLMKQTAENSISKNAGFEKMRKLNGDVTLLVSTAAIPEMYARQINQSFPANFDPKELQMLASLNFEKGEILFQGEYYTENKELEALLKKNEKIFTKLNSSFIKDFPASTLAFLNLGANGEQLYNLLLENQEFRNTVSIAKADEVKALFSSFNGDLSIGLINVAMKENTASFLAYADVTNGDALKTVYTNKNKLGLKRGEDIVQLSDNEYVFKTKGMNVFFGVKGKQMYATNDELLYKGIGKAIDKSIKDTGYASDMKGKNLFAVINIEAILELPIIKMMLNFSGEEIKMYHSLVSEIAYIEASNESGGKNEITFILKNKEVNALKQIVNFAKQFAGM